MAVGDRLLGIDSTTALFAPVVQNAQDARVAAIVNSLLPVIGPLTAVIVGNGSAQIPNRPNTTNPVGFNTTTFVPSGGTTAGGTPLMVAGLDFWLFAGSGSGSGASYVLENPMGSGTYPNRPATSSIVAFKGVVAPAGGGTTAGGTPLMVNGLDEFHQYVS